MKQHGVTHARCTKRSIAIAIPSVDHTARNHSGLWLQSFSLQGQLSILENVTALAREQIKLEDVCIASYEVADAMMKARQA